MTAIRGKEAVHPLVGTMPAILAKCSCAINPLIYVATNTQFRREFEKRLCGRRPTGKRDGTLNGSFGTTIQGSTRTQQSTMHTLDTGPYNEHIAMTTIKEDCKMDADAIAMENCGDTTPLGYGDSSDDNKDALLEEEVTTDASDGRRESIDSIWLTSCLLIYFRNHDNMVCITYDYATGLYRKLDSVTEDQGPLILHSQYQVLMTWRRKEAGHQQPLYSTGVRLSIKISSCQHKNSHYKDKTVSRSWPSSLYNENRIHGKTVFILKQGPDS